MNVEGLIKHLQRLLAEGMIKEDYHVAVWINGEAIDLTLSNRDIDNTLEFIAFYTEPRV